MSNNNDREALPDARRIPVSAGGVLNIPPLGVQERKSHVAYRAHDLIAALERYRIAGALELDCVAAWARELAVRVEELHNLRGIRA